MTAIIFIIGLSMTFPLYEKTPLLLFLYKFIISFASNISSFVGKKYFFIILICDGLIAAFDCIPIDFDFFTSFSKASIFAMFIKGLSIEIKLFIEHSRIILDRA